MKTVFKTSRPARDGESRSSLDPQIQNTPAIDWNFQSSASALRGGAGTFQRSSRASFAGFRAISNGFFEAEAKREFRIEAAAFGVIVALAVWPMVQAAQALLDLIK